MMASTPPSPLQRYGVVSLRREGWASAYPWSAGWSRCTGGAITAHNDGPAQGSEFVVRLPALSDERVASPGEPAEVQFEGALVSSAVVVFEKSPPPPGHAAAFSAGGSLPGPSAVREVPLLALRPRDKWSKHAAGAAGAGPVPRPCPRLGDLFAIKRGLATGANGFFILGREDAFTRGIPPAFLTPILPNPRQLRGDSTRARP
jgi:hypothetical protein